MKLTKQTPVMIVEAVEPSLAFWVEKLGFEKKMEVPEGDRLAFACLERDGVEVMLQTRASAATDVPQLAKDRGFTYLYLEVDDLDGFEKRLGDTPRVIPRRVAPYGMEEIVVREPAGNVVTVARRAAAAR